MRDLPKQARVPNVVSMRKREPGIGQATRSELRRRRKASKLSQREVASRCGVAYGLISTIDVGREGGSVTVDSLVAYARGLGTQGWRVLRDVEEAAYGEDAP